MTMMTPEEKRTVRITVKALRLALQELIRMAILNGEKHYYDS
jgi:hypothetical protein